MKAILFIAAICISFNGFCQKEEYLVKNDGDTIRGKITLQGKAFYVDNENPVEIKADDVSQIKSSDYKGTVVLHCKLQTYSDNLDDMEIDWIEKGTIDTVMVLDEIYSTKKINLYFAKSNLKTQYYFYKTPSDPKPVQLVVRYYFQGGLDNYTRDRGRYRGEKSKVSVVEDKGYVNQLYDIMSNCNKIPPTMWELLTYRNYSLIQLIKRYNKCK
ncbi:MAG: hypothetical protein WBP16_08295 [Ferruginibacter sp.]